MKVGAEAIPSHPELYLRKTVMNRKFAEKAKKSEICAGKC